LRGRGVIANVDAAVRSPLQHFLKSSVR
jgi:hypothetical protein